ncbi:unnamed protein product [Blepharisma stoltei]|uniref:GB1/RHD3-type G domain-containing protein n=1 Tax=Blepharisma stoltei TaxID=1481888 RepID=A0AAU9J8N3_9CILI|nr:unnamed protein product [Blepharisma stoltei]
MQTMKAENKHSFSYVDRPLPLITINNDTREFIIDPDAIDFLKSLDSPICVISVAGMYRTGKSYLLNRVLLNRKRGFGVGPTINPCTRGLWVWGTPIPGTTKDGKPCTIVIIDSEGIGSIEEDSNHDTRIFSLAILLSSYFIYNSIGSIDENAIQNLSLVVNITKQIHIRSSQAQGEILDSEAYAKYFPSFLWVVRDFTLRLIDSEGRPISSREYLENALKLQKGISDMIEEKNRIRKLLTHFFRDIDCATLVRPTEREEDLQRLDDMNPDQLRPEFVEQISELRNKVFAKVKPKMLNGKQLSGEMLLVFMQSYIDSMNSGCVPNIENAWNYICKAQNKRAFEDAAQTYERILGSASRKLPVMEEQIKALHKEGKSAAVDHYHKQCVGDEKTRSLNELTDYIAKRYMAIKSENANQAKKEAVAFLKEKYIEIETKIKSGEINNFSEFDKAIKELENQYSEQCPQGPGSKECFLEFCKDKYAKATEKFIKQVTNSMEIQQTVSTEKITNLENDLRSVKDQLINEKSESQKATCVLLTEKSELLVKEKSLREQVYGLIYEKERMENELKELRSNLRSVTQKEEEKTKAKIAEISDLLREHDKEHERKESEYEEEKAIFEQKIKFLENAVEDYKQKDKSSSEKFKETRNDHLQAIKSLQSKYEAQSNALQEKLDEKTKEVVELESEIEVKEGIIEELQFKLQDDSLRQKQNSDLQPKLEALTKEMKNKEDSYIKLIENIKKESNDTIMKLRARLDESEKKLKAFEDSQRNDMTQWAQDNAILVQKIEFLEQEIEEYKLKIEESHRHHEVMISALETLKGPQVDSEASIQKIRAEQSEEISRIQKDYEVQKSKLLSRIEDLLDTKSGLETKMKMEKNEWLHKEKQLNEQLEEAISEKNRLQKELSAKITIEEPRSGASLIDYEREIEELRKTHTDEIDEIKSQNEYALLQLKTFYDQEKNRLEQRIQQEKSKAARQIEEITEDCEKRIEHEIAIRDEEIDAFQEEFKEFEISYNAEIMKLNERIELDAQKYESLEKYAANLKQQLSDSHSAHSSSLETNLDSFNKQKAILQEKIDKIAAENSEKERELLAFRNEKDKYENLYESKSKDFDDLYEKYNKEKKELIEQISTLKEKFEALQNESSKQSSKSKRELALANNEISLLHSKISELEESLQESEKQHKENIENLKEETNSLIQSTTQRLSKDNENLQKKFDEKKRAFKQLSSSSTKQIALYEKEIAVLEEKLQHSDRKRAEIEKYYQDSLMTVKAHSQSPEKVSPVFQATNPEVESLRMQISKLDRELQARQTAYDRDKSLWENKFNFLLQQRDHARKELAAAQDKFDLIVDELKKKSAAEREKLESSTTNLLSTMESKYSSQAVELQNRYEQTIKDMRDKNRESERKLQEMIEELENEKRERSCTVVSFERKLQQSQDTIKKLKQDMDQERFMKENSINGALEKIAKEKEDWKQKAKELEKKCKELENQKAQQFIQHEKERAKWGLEKDSIMSKYGETQQELSHAIKRQESLKKENEKLRTPRPKTLISKRTMDGLSTNTSYEDFQKFASMSGRSTPTNSNRDTSPRPKLTRTGSFSRALSESR